MSTYNTYQLQVLEAISMVLVMSSDLHSYAQYLQSKYVTLTLTVKMDQG